MGLVLRGQQSTGKRAFGWRHPNLELERITGARTVRSPAAHAVDAYPFGTCEHGFPPFCRELDAFAAG